LTSGSSIIDNSIALKAVRIIVHGVVHGVFFRQSTVEKATALNIRGTVRNVDDGTVEIVAEGNENSLKRLIEWCHDGPPRAEVTQVDVREEQLKNFEGFVIRR
jgi:acylphosphatase